MVAENGRPYRNQYVTFFTFDDDGLITKWREFYDAGVVVKAFRPDPRRVVLPTTIEGDPQWN